MTTAHLGLAVDSGSVTRATPELQKMTAAAGQAEGAAERLRAASTSEAAAHNSAATAAKMHAAALHAQAAAARMATLQRTNMIFQLQDVGVSLASGMNPFLVAVQQGSQILQYGLAPALKSVGDLAVNMVTRFWPVTAVLGAVAVAIGGMTSAINDSSDVTVTFGDTALAVWQVIGNGIYQFVKPALDWLIGNFSAFWDYISPSLKAAGNGIIATFLGIFDGISAAWSALTNNIMAGLDLLASGATTRQIKGIGDIAKDVAGAFSGAFGQDYLGGFFGAVSGQAKKNAIARIAEDAEGAEKATKSLAENGFGQLIGMTNTFADATRSAFSNLGSGIIDAFKKGGDVASNFFTMILDRVGQVGESLLNTGLNSLLDIGINAIFGGIGGGLGSGAIGRGVYGGMGGFFPSFPGMASGGTVARAGMSWVGENGPELLHLPKGAQVIPNGPSMAMAANQNSAPVININIDARGAERSAGPDIAREVRKALPDAMQAYNRNPLRRAG